MKRIAESNRGNAAHPFPAACVQNNSRSKVSPYCPMTTNGQAERVTRNLMEIGQDKFPFKDSERQQKALCRFVNFYHPVKPHKGLKGDTPFEVLQTYFSQPVV
ncbi:hypothetical protein [Neisseria iguanae]|nr:hypothetical protein [Neisseria iguanae]